VTLDAGGAPLRLRLDLGAPRRQPVWPAEIRLRSFSAADAEAVERLLVEVWPIGVAGAPDGWFAEVRKDTEWDASLVRLAWSERDELLGLCHAWTSGFIKDVAVAVPARRRGLASALILDMADTLARRGHSAVDLKVMPTNLAARALYQRLGFRLVPD
jgi:ribosomal protein S18 acetylase RimI-like enzyme